MIWLLCIIINSFSGKQQTWDHNSKTNEEIFPPPGICTMVTLNQNQWATLTPVNNAFSNVQVMTLSVLYWNYYETAVRRSTKKQGIILDHWGKGSSSSSSNVYPDSEYLKDKMQEGVNSDHVTIEEEFVTKDRIKRSAVSDRTSLSRDSIKSSRFN